MTFTNGLDNRNIPFFLIIEEFTDARAEKIAYETWFGFGLAGGRDNARHHVRGPRPGQEGPHACSGLHERMQASALWGAAGQRPAQQKNPGKESQLAAPILTNMLVKT
eukprot:scaffold166459_cov49-Prasinocladus_malaysianus.AAC.1